MITYIVDTNVLLRYLLKDDKNQYALAEPYFISKQHQLYLPIHSLCEVVWLMKNKLKVPRQVIIDILLDLTSATNVITDQHSFDKGIMFLKNGGDFADGVIANVTQNIENSVLLTFDKNSSKVSNKLNIPNQLLNIQK